MTANSRIPKSTADKTLDEWIGHAKQWRKLEDREDALQVLRNHGLRHDRDKTLRAFTELLSDKAPTVRSLAAVGLRKAGRPTDPKAAAKLVEIISQDLSGLKLPRKAGEVGGEFGGVMRAIGALEVIGETNHIPALKRVSENEKVDSIMRQSAAKAVVQIEKRASEEPTEPVQAPADNAANGTVAPGDKEAAVDRILVATVFGKPLYLKEQPVETDAKRKELPLAEFDEWLRTYQGVRVYGAVWREVLSKYSEREKITVTNEELGAIAASVERQMKSAPQPQIATSFTPEQRKGIAIFWQRGSLMDWKVCKSLYEKYGGRVGLGSLGAWTAFDGQNALLREHHEAGDIKFHDALMEQAFWEHTKIKNFADTYPTGEPLKRLLATPPYMWK